MDLNSGESVSIKTSYSGHLVPIVRGICLHSPYDPIIEANKLLKRYEEKIKNNYRFLFLGLGFGHHIDVLIKKLENQEKDIVVIEKNVQVYQHCLKIKNNEFSKKIKFIIGHSVDQIYQNYNFVRFLSSHPVIIPLQAAFDLDQDYFSQLLTYQAPNHLASIIDTIQNQSLKEYLSKFQPDTTIQEVTAQIETSKEICQSSHLLYAYREIINETGI